MGTKISALTLGSALGGTEVIPAVQGGANVKFTAAQIRTWAQTGLVPLASSGSGADLTNGSVSLPKLAAQANNTVIGNISGSSAPPIALTAAQLAGIIIGAPSTQAGTSYTAVLGDAFTCIRFTNGSPINFTIPPNSSVAFPMGTEIDFEQAGAGLLTIVAGGGVTLNSRGGVHSTAGQYGVGTVKKVGTDTWTLVGDLA
jgi:hypothetical protein